MGNVYCKKIIVRHKQKKRNHRKRLDSLLDESKIVILNMYFVNPG